MDKRCEMDNVRLAAVYRRFNKDPKVDINDPENIIIALEKEIEQYRGKLEYAESRINALCAQQMEIIKLEQKLNKEREELHKPVTLEAVQENAVGEIIKALAVNGYDSISINAYKSKEE